MNVTVYSTPTCPWCKKVKELLTKHNIDFNDIDVASDQEKAQEMISKSGQMGVPVTIIEKDGNEEVIIGFDEKAFKKQLDLK